MKGGSERTTAPLAFAHASQAEEHQPRSLRRDAARNRDLIIVAARELLAARGLGVGLNEIAHHAGLGVGTVYRRFPDREALVAAALAEPLAAISQIAERAVAQPRAWDGLSQLLTGGAEALAANLGLRAMALEPPAGAALGVRDRFAAVGDELRRRAISEGDLRPDVTGEDVLLVLWMVTELAVHAVDVAPEAFRRYLQLLLDGLRSGPERGALVPTVTPEQADEISRRWAGR